MRPARRLTGDDIVDAEWERTFYDQVRLSNGVWKSTAASRLDDLNELVGRSLLHLTQPLAILDVGVSSGVTTVEWSIHISDLHLAHHITASDTCFGARLCSYGRIADILIDPRNQTVLYVGVPGGHFRVVRHLIDSKTVTRMLTALARRRAGRSREISLINPAVVECEQVTTVDDDVFVSRPEWAERFDVIRAANLLNLGYFPRDQLALAVSNLASRLRNNGLFIVCRTHADGSNHATIFRYQDHRFSAVAHLGTGSEIEDLVLGPV